MRRGAPTAWSESANRGRPRNTYLTPNCAIVCIELFYDNNERFFKLCSAAWPSRSAVAASTCCALATPAAAATSSAGSAGAPARLLCPQVLGRRPDPGARLQPQVLGRGPDPGARQSLGGVEPGRGAERLLWARPRATYLGLHKCGKLSQDYEELRRGR